MGAAAENHEMVEQSTNETRVPTTPVELSKDVASILQQGGIYRLGEDFIDGKWSTADLGELLFRIVSGTLGAELSTKKIEPRFLWFLLKDRLKNTQVGKGAFEVAKRHYDLGNDLFSTMLDNDTMTYTCGYWRDAGSLEEAQRAKIDLLCRKLELRPGMRVLDIGCGWGNFAEHAAARYGVSVVGLTVSTEQAELARSRCHGLDVEIVLEDYQKFAGSFDRIVSIEMIEAVGRKNMRSFFQMVQRCLKPSGLFGLQAISADTFSRTSRPVLDQYILWLQKRIFPNGYLPNMKHLTAPEQHGLVIEDIHNFSADYAKTLRVWADRFELGWTQLSAKYGEEFRRMWLFYLLGCEALFRARMVQLYQIVYSKGGVMGGYISVR